MSNAAKPVALTPVQLGILAEIVAGKSVDKDTGRVWLGGREKRAAALKLVAVGFLTGDSFGHWYAITDAGRAALKAPRAALCAGCDAALPALPYGGHGFEVEIAPNVRVRVCCGRSYRCASSACAAKARVRARRCPGCGAEDTDIGEVCSDCKTNIERGRTLKDRKLEWWCVVANGLGPHLSFPTEDGSRAYPLEELATLLGAALAVGRTKIEHGCVDVGDRTIPHGSGVRTDRGDKVCVEVTREQGEAMAALVQKIRQVTYLAYRDGLHAGKDMLGRLARGDESVRDFEKSEDREDEHLGRILAELEAKFRAAYKKQKEVPR